MFDHTIFPTAAQRHEAVRRPTSRCMAMTSIATVDVPASWFLSFFPARWVPSAHANTQMLWHVPTRPCQRATALALSVAAVQLAESGSHLHSNHTTPRYHKTMHRMGNQCFPHCAVLHYRSKAYAMQTAPSVCSRRCAKRSVGRHYRFAYIKIPEP